MIGSPIMKADPNLYDYWPYADRPKIVWPEGKKLAFWIAPNIEFYEFMPPGNPKRTHGQMPFLMCNNIASGTLAIEWAIYVLWRC